MLELEQIRIDGGTQSRVELNQETVAEYAQAFTDGAEFPPVVVFFDGASYWLADGFHRYFGARDAGESAVFAEIKHGTQLDAQLFSFGVNAAHGLRRSNADKRKAVTGALQHPVSCKWSDNQIAKHCGVDHKTVAAVRASILGNSQDTSPADRTVTRNGTTYTQNTANVGKKKGNGTGKPVTTQAKTPFETEPSGDQQAIEPASVEPEDDGPSAAEIAAHQAAEAADRALVATLLDSDEPLAALAAENKQLKAEIAQLKLARDGYMNRCNEAIALVKARDRQIAKLEKLLKETA